MSDPPAECMWCRWGDSPFGPWCPIHEQLPPGHTDLMVTPESLDTWLADNPLVGEAEPMSDEWQIMFSTFLEQREFENGCERDCLTFACRFRREALELARAALAGEAETRGTNADHG